MSTVILKIGSSILVDRAALHSAVAEVYAVVRAGKRVVVVVSALAGKTDRLLAEANTFASEPHPAASAVLLATGEQHALATLTLALDAAGVPARCLDARQLGLRTTGPLLDAAPRDLDAARLEDALAVVPVVVVPGFVGCGECDSLSLLGRGGSDLTAILIASALGAECHLLKDTVGWHTADPARGPADLYTSLQFDEAASRPGPIVQPKAVALARELRQPFIVRGLGSTRGTVVGDAETRRASGLRPAPLRVTLLGAGTVGGGVAAIIGQVPDLEIVACLVRRAGRLRPDAIAGVVTTDRDAALAVPSDVVVETIGDVGIVESLVERALESGRDVVTANKGLLARRGPELDSLAARHGARILGSAAVGGGVPMLETVSARAGRVRSLRGVLNGTSSAVAALIDRGVAPDEAIEQARAAGLAEADVSADIDGHDAACKITILARAAFGPDVDVDLSVRGLDLGVRTRGRAHRLLATAVDDGARVRATVRPALLAPSDPLARGRGPAVGLEIVEHDGARAIVTGLGAGRWPTAQSVVGDLRALSAAGSTCREASVA